MLLILKSQQCSTYPATCLVKVSCQVEFPVFHKLKCPFFKRLFLSLIVGRLRSFTTVTSVTMTRLGHSSMRCQSTLRPPASVPRPPTCSEAPARPPRSPGWPEDGPANIKLRNKRETFSPLLSTCTHRQCGTEGNF